MCQLGDLGLESRNLSYSDQSVNTSLIRDQRVANTPSRSALISSCSSLTQPQ